MTPQERRGIACDLMMTAREEDEKLGLVLELAAALKSGKYVDLAMDKRLAAGANRAWKLSGGWLVHCHGYMSIVNGMRTQEVNELKFAATEDEAYGPRDATRQRYEFGERGFRLNAWLMVQANEEAVRKALVRP